MLATDMTTSGSAEEKARWTFKMFDTDASGIKKNIHIIINVLTLMVRGLELFGF